MDSVLDRRVVSNSSDRSGAPSALKALAEVGPRLDAFLLGRSHAHGMFQDFTGAVRRRFLIRLDGRMEAGAILLREDFLFDDGAEEQRTWRITQHPDGRYSATADDMIGEAHGAVRGGVLRWSYLFSLRIGSRRVRVRFHDTFAQISETELLNIARATKFGMEIGRATIVFRRQA